MKTWIVGKWLYPREQRWAPSGTHFHQFVVPPIFGFRKDCTYGKLAAIKLPKDVQGLGMCEVCTLFNFVLPENSLMENFTDCFGNVNSIHLTEELYMRVTPEGWCIVWKDGHIMRSERSMWTGSTLSGMQP